MTGKTCIGPKEVFHLWRSNIGVWWPWMSSNKQHLWFSSCNQTSLLIFDAGLRKQIFPLFSLPSFCPAEQNTEILDNLAQQSTASSVLTTVHICLDVLLHQLAAINTRLLSTCAWISGIWAELSEVCWCIIRISARTLSPSLWTLSVRLLPTCSMQCFVVS